MYISIKDQSPYELAQQVDAFYQECTYLELMITGLLPASKQGLGIWNPEEVYGESPLCSYQWMKHAKAGTALVLKGELAVIKTEVLVARLNFIKLMRQKGGILPPAMIEDLKSEVIWFDASDENSPPLMKRLLGIFGHKIIGAPHWKSTGIDVPAFAYKTPYLEDPKAEWEGELWTPADLLEWWWVQEADFGGYLAACATKTGSTPNELLLYGTLWVEWAVDGVRFPTHMRDARNYYTIRVPGGETHWIDDKHTLLGNQLMWWCMSATPLGTISKSLNRDATELVAPSRVYGDPSPLNKSQDANTIGHLALDLAKVYPMERSVKPMLPVIYTDDDAFAPVIGAELAYEAGLPVLYQHQLESARVGEIAAACGKSTFVLVVRLANGKLRKVLVSLQPYKADKDTKTLNRDSLLGRCPALLKVIRKESQGKDETLANHFTALASSLLS